MSLLGISSTGRHVDKRCIACHNGSSPLLSACRTCLWSACLQNLAGRICNQSTRMPSTRARLWCALGTVVWGSGCFCLPAPQAMPGCQLRNEKRHCERPGPDGQQQASAVCSCSIYLLLCQQQQLLLSGPCLLTALRSWGLAAAGFAALRPNIRGRSSLCTAAWSTRRARQPRPLLGDCGGARLLCALPPVHNEASPSWWR